MAAQVILLQLSQTVRDLGIAARPDAVEDLSRFIPADLLSRVIERWPAYVARQVVESVRSAVQASPRLVPAVRTHILRAATDLLHEHANHAFVADDLDQMADSLVQVSLLGRTEEALGALEAGEGLGLMAVVGLVDILRRIHSKEDVAERAIALREPLVRIVQEMDAFSQHLEALRTQGVAKSESGAA